MICLAASVPLLTSWQPRSVAVGSTDRTPCHKGIGTPGLHFGVVRPAQFHHHDGLVGVRGLPLLGHLGAHRKRYALLVAARHRNAGVAQRAEERRQDDALLQGLQHTRASPFRSPRCASVAASMPCATIWSTFCVMTAESDLPSNTNTSAPYFSLAYFCASVACAWWNTLRSDQIRRTRSSSASSSPACSRRRRAPALESVQPPEPESAQRPVLWSVEQASRQGRRQTERSWRAPARSIE